MEYLKTLDAELGRSADANVFWKALLQIGLRERGSSKIGYLEKQDLNRQSKTIKKRILEGLATDPIDANVKSIYFGLFDKEDSNFNPIQGFYLSGSSKERDAAGDFLCDSVWKPTWGYFRSKLLNSIVQIGQGIEMESKFIGKENFEIRFLPDGRVLKLKVDGSVLDLTGEEKSYWLSRRFTSSEDDDFFSYFLAFGAAISIAKCLKDSNLFGTRDVFVGFDSGDFLEVK